MQGQHPDTTKAAANDYWEFLKEYSGHISTEQKNLTLKGYRQMRRRCLKSEEYQLPTTLLTYMHYNVSTHDKQTETDVAVFNRKQYASTDWILCYELSYVKVKEVKKFHERMHEHCGRPCDTSHVTISSDGVPASNSGGKSFDIVSIRFRGCK